MFKIFLLLSFAGLLTHTLINLQVLNRATPELGFFDTVKKYWRINSFFIVASVIATAVLSFLLTLDGGDKLIEILTGGNISNDKPFGFYATAYLIGFVIDYILAVIRKLVNPIKVVLNDKQNTGS